MVPGSEPAADLDCGAVKRALVCGAGGFIGAHLARRLVEDGYWVRGTDIKEPEFAPTAAHDFVAGIRQALDAAA